MNKIKTLDSGWVALAGCSLDKNQLRCLLDENIITSSDNRINDLITISIAIKAPMFVKLALSEFGLSTITKKQSNKLEYYSPKVNEVNAGDLETSKRITNNIKMMSDLLVNNWIGYVNDGCERSVSQVNTPLCVYNTTVVTGTLRQWLSFVYHNKLPKLTEEYRAVVESILLTEYNEVIDVQKKEEKIPSS